MLPPRKLTNSPYMFHLYFNVPIELKPSLVPWVPRYLSFCNPAFYFDKLIFNNMILECKFLRTLIFFQYVIFHTIISLAIFNSQQSNIFVIYEWKHACWELFYGINPSSQSWYLNFQPMQCPIMWIYNWNCVGLIN